jgi:uncharacterized protein (DUF433 family)
MLQLDHEKIPLSADDNGVLLMSGTRVPLDSVVDMFDEGASPEEIVDQFDTLKLDDVYAVITYYLRHEEEVRAHLAKEERTTEAVRMRINAAFPSNRLRERLLKMRREPDDPGA